MTGFLVNIIRPAASFVSRWASALGADARRLPASAHLFILLSVLVLTLPVIVSCQTSGGTGAAALREEPTIRVRVRAGVESVAIAPEAGGRLTAEPRRGGRPDGTAVAFDAAGTAAIETAGVVLDTPAGKARAVVGSVLRVTPARGGLVLVDGAAMPGRVEIVPTGALLDVVVELPMELYLQGVLAGELYASWPVGAFQAQAVASRSYAMHERQRARSKQRHYDIESTTIDQMFVGATQNRQAAKAVETTRGVVIYDHGKLLRAYYSSTCGDRAASAAGVWPTRGEFIFNSAPALQARDRDCPCEKSPLYRWKRERSDEELRARLRAWGASAGNRVSGVDVVESIEIAQKNRVGRADKYRITDRRGAKHTLSAEELRVALNTAAAGQPEVTRDTRIPSGDFVATRSAGVMMFEGQGYGHGVGLCQWGAFGQASEGTPWRKIVLHYYPGAELVRLW